jgi:tetratricopeptide (TPR) repeat protein
LGDVHYVRADYYSGNRSQKDQAVADYEEVIRTYHIVETEYPKLDIGRSSNLAQTYLALNMPYEAISILDKQKKQILVDQASHPGLHQYELDLTNRMLGAVHRRLKNYTEAIASYRLVQNEGFRAEVQSSIKNLQKLEALGN